MKKRIQKKRASKGPTKAQLVRENKRLLAKCAWLAKAQGDAQRSIEAARRERDAAIGARNQVLDVLGELAPDVVLLLTNPDRLSEAPPGNYVRLPELPRPVAPIRSCAEAYSMAPTPIQTYWLTRLRIYMYEHQRLGWAMCFHARRPRGHDSLGMEMIVADYLLERSPTVFREAFEHCARQIATAFERKMYGR